MPEQNVDQARQEAMKEIAAQSKKAATPAPVKAQAPEESELDKLRKQLAEKEEQLKTATAPKAAPDKKAEGAPTSPVDINMRTDNSEENAKAEREKTQKAFQQAEQNLNDAAHDTRSEADKFRDEQFWDAVHKGIKAAPADAPPEIKQKLDDNFEKARQDRWNSYQKVLAEENAKRTGNQADAQHTPDKTNDSPKNVDAVKPQPSSGGPGGSNAVSGNANGTGMSTSTSGVGGATAGATQATR